MTPALRLFGVPALLAGDTPLRLNAKEFALLAYLRVTGRPHTRGALGALLWSNVFTGRNNSVNTALSALRRVLPAGALPAGADPVALCAQIDADVDAIVAGVQEDADTDAVLQALHTHRAPFMDGFEFQLGEGAEELAGWIRERRSAFETALRRALEEHCEVAAARGDGVVLRRLVTAGEAALPEWKARPEWVGVGGRMTVRSPAGWAGVAAVAATVVVVIALAQRREAVASAPQCSPGEARAQLVRQTYPAEANLAVRTGERYTPTWYLKNVGQCAWGAGTRVARTTAFGPAPLTSGEGMRRSRRAVQPDSVVEFGIPVRGPQAIGAYGEDWLLIDPAGARIALAEGAALQIRFQVLPDRVAECGPGEIVAELLAQSHPRRDTRYRPREAFSVSWTLVNRGKCAWGSGASLRFASASGPRLSSRATPPVPVEEPVRPTEAYTFHVGMRAPADDDTYREAWELVGPDGRVVRVSDASEVDVRIVVSRAREVWASAPMCAPGAEIVTFLGSERVADGSIVPPGARLPKEWTLFNRGECTWPAGGLRLRHVRSDPEFSNPSWADAVLDRDVPPQGTFTFRAPFTAPRVPGHYRAHWQMYNANGDSVIISKTWTIWADFNVERPARPN